MMLGLMFVTAATAWAGEKPILNVESINGYYWGVQITGWAYDPEEPGNDVDILMDFYSDAEFSQFVGAVLLSTSEVREEVNAEYNLTGTHGFGITRNIGHYPTFTDGTFYVLIFARDKTDGDISEVYRSSAFVVGAQAAPQYTGNSLEITPETEALRVGDGCTITGTGGWRTCIWVEDGATVKLSGINITAENYHTAHRTGIKCLGNATIILDKGTTNIIKGGRYDDPCIQAGPRNTTLTIKGCGSLDASSYGKGACIGAAMDKECGNITIEDGNYKLETYYVCLGQYLGGMSAAIGSSQETTCGNITIKGGTIDAESSAAAIGTGWMGQCGNITITGGDIRAKATHAVYGGAAIGSALDGTCGNIDISGLTRVITTKDVNAPYCIGPGRGNTACGTLTLWGVASDYPTGDQYGNHVLSPTDITYTVSFHANGGTGEMAGQAFYSNMKQNLKANTFTFDGKYFSHWSTLPDGSGHDYADGESVTNLGNITLYAQWHDHYTVHFNANGGTGEMADQQITSFGQALNANTFTRTDYSFVGWNTAADGTGTGYADGEAVRDLGTVTLYAQWHITNYNVQFNANNGSGEMADQSFTCNTPQALNANTFTREHYTFVGWNSKADGSGVAYADGQTVTNPSDILYAQWHINNSITFNSNYGTESTIDLEYPWYTSVTMPSDTFTRTGYTLTGWNTKSDGTGVPFDKGEEVFNLNNFVLYAQWSLTEYTINYVNAEDGTDDVTNSNPTSYTINTGIIALEEPERFNYVFDGWTYDDVTVPTKTVTIPDGSTRNWTFTAHWTLANPLTLRGNTAFLQIPDGYTLTGTGGADTHVTIPDGATITLSGVTINAIADDISHMWAGITCEGNATIILDDGTTNTLVGSRQRPGIFVPEGKTLTIQGWGALTSSSRGGAPGIGATYSQNCGNIVIQGGSVTAWGGYGCAGIGGSEYASCGNITITDGVNSVTATAGQEVPNSIGAGKSSGCGTVTIGGVTTGNVTLNPYTYKPSESVFTTVVFYANGGTGEMEIQQIVSNIPCALNTCTFTRTDYVFSLWNTKADGSGTDYADGQDGRTVAGTETLTLYAQWRLPNEPVRLTSGTGHLVVTDGQVLTGTGGADTHVVIADGATVTLRDVNITAIQNNESHRWAGISCQGDATIILEGENSLKGGHYYYPGIHVPTSKMLTIQGDGTLNATANSNGVACGIGGGNELPCGNIVIEGGIINATAVGNAAGIGGGNAGYCGDITIMGGTITATGSLDSPGIGGVQSCGKITITDGVTNVTATGGNRASYCIGADVIGTITIHGINTGIVALPTYTYIPSESTVHVTFDSNGGTGSMTDQTFLKGLPIALNACDFTRNDYDFDGWNTQADGNGTSYTDKQRITINDNLIVYAQWREREYVLVSFDANGGTGTMDAQSFYTGVLQYLNANAFTRDGYVFNGWNTQADGNGITYTDGQLTTLQSDLTLYAKWKTWRQSSGLELSNHDGDVTLDDGDYLICFTTNRVFKNIIIKNDATVKLYDLSLNGYISCEGDATIILNGDIKIASDDRSCIFVPAGHTLTIKGDGTLNVRSNHFNYAGIGGGYKLSCGNIVIAGGTITASSPAAAGIGGGDSSSCGNITVTGGITSLTATGTPPIGAGSIGTCGTITVCSTLTDEISVNGKTRTLTGPGLDLVDGGDNRSSIEQINGKTVKAILTDRKLYKDGDWNTLCLPFAVSSFTNTPLEGATVMTLSSSSLSGSTLSLNFTEVTSIEAGKPYIVKWTKADGYVDDNDHNLWQPLFTDISVSKVAANIETEYVDFIGITSPVMLNKDDNTVLYLGANNNLYWPTAFMNIKSCRAYFQLKGLKASDVSETRMYFEDFDSEDGIKSIDNGQLIIDNEAGAVYDLSGRKVNCQLSTVNSQLKKGIYIVNGKKVLF